MQLWEIMTRIISEITLPGCRVLFSNADEHTYRAQDAPHSLGGAQAQQFSWNYDHVAALWKHEQWLPQAAVDLARAHYSAYMVRRKDGLRVITLNTDFCKLNTFSLVLVD